MADQVRVPAIATIGLSGGLHSNLYGGGYLLGFRLSLPSGPPIPLIFIIFYYRSGFTGITSSLSSIVFST